MRRNLILLTMALLGLVLCEAQSSIKTLSNGRGTIYKSSNGFYVGADLKYDISRTGAYTQPMMLGLYTSQTLLPKTCLGFSSFNCDFSASCFKTYDKADVTYPYFSASGEYIKPDIYLDYTYWKAWGTSGNVLSASSCYSYSSVANSLGSGTSGIIGLGFKGSASYNFQTFSPVFSIYLKPDLSQGTLMFSRDYSYAKTSSSVTYWSTDSNWQASFSGTLYVGSTFASSITVGIMFDINSDAIGLPTIYYNLILDTLKSYGVSCSSTSYYKPFCTYSGYMANLPDISLKYSPSITIPPQIYVQSYTNQTSVSSITLNIKAIGNGYTNNKNYVVNAYSNYIILDSNFMAYYYTIFDASSSSSPKIYLYYASSSGSSSDGSIWQFIVIAILFVFIGICRCFYNASKVVTTVATATVIANATANAITSTKTESQYVPPVVVTQQPQFYSQPVQHFQQPQAFAQQPQAYIQPTQVYNQQPQGYVQFQPNGQPQFQPNGQPQNQVYSNNYTL